MSTSSPRFLCRSLPLAAALTVLLVGASAQAAPVTYLFTGTGTGTLGNSTFTNAAFTITAEADTVNIFLSGVDISVVQSTSTTISIAGLSTATFTTPQRIFNNRQTTIVGVNDVNLADRLNLINPTLNTYDLATSLGPIGGDSAPVTSAAVPTNLGALNLNTAGTSGTFQAITQNVTVAPEPGTVALVAMGLVGTARMVIRRRHNTL